MPRYLLYILPLFFLPTLTLAALTPAQHLRCSITPIFFFLSPPDYCIQEPEVVTEIVEVPVVVETTTATHTAVSSSYVTEDQLASALSSINQSVNRPIYTSPSIFNSTTTYVTNNEYITEVRTGSSGSTSGLASSLSRTTDTLEDNLSLLQSDLATLSSSHEALSTSFMGTGQWMVNGDDAYRLTGNIGIGTTSPSEKLSVNGNGLFNGTVSASVFYLGDTPFVADFGSDTNTFIGNGAGTSTTTATLVTAIGYQSQKSITTGGGTSVGHLSLADLTTGVNNTAVGQGTLRYITTSTNNTAIGRQAANALLSGSANIALGSNAMQSVQYATNTVAIGVSALLGSTDAGSDGIFIGNSTGRSIAGGSGNTFVGTSAGGTGSKTGSNNLLLGKGAGSNLTTGSNNIVIGGNGINLPSATASNQLNIGNLIYGTNLDGSGATLSTGNVGVGTTNPESKFDVFGTISARAASTFGQTVEQLRLGRSDSNIRYQSIYTGDHSSSPTQNFIQFRVHDGQTTTSQTTVMSIFGNGNVGIGATSSLVAKLHVQGSNPGGELSGLYIGNNTGTGTLNSEASIYLSAAGGTSLTRAAIIKGINTGESSNGHALAFFTNPNSSSPLERMRIDASGNVGIGTTTPDYKLQVFGSGEVARLGNNAASDTYLSFRNGNGAYFGYTQTAGSFPAAVIQGGSQKGILMYTGNSTFANGTPSMAITSTGNVGIGTSSPQYLFDVYASANGSVRSAVTNPAATGAALAVLLASNGLSNDDGIEVRAFGTGFTTSGANIQDSGQVNAGPNLSGGLTLVSRNSSAPMRFYTGGNLDANERMTILSGGNVGIGTTAPITRLANTDTNIVDFAGSKNVDNAGLTWKVATAANKYVAGFANTTNSTGAGGVVINTANTDSGTYVLQLVAGGVETASFTGNGGAFKPGGGSFSATSDKNAKKNIEALMIGLDAINALNPVTFQYNGMYASAPDNGKTYVGLIAQDVVGTPFEPYLLDVDGQSGLYRLDPSAIPFALIGAVKELDEKVSVLPTYEDATFTERLLAFFKGIAEHGEALVDRVRTKELCVDDVCVTRDQFKAMVDFVGTHQSDQPNQSGNNNDNESDEEIVEEVVDNPVEEVPTETEAVVVEEPVTAEEEEIEVKVEEVSTTEETSTAQE